MFAESFKGYQKKSVIKSGLITDFFILFNEVYCIIRPGGLSGHNNSKSSRKSRLNLAALIMDIIFLCSLFIVIKVQKYLRYPKLLKNNCQHYFDTHYFVTAQVDRLKVEG